jgi:RNA polymerase sigma-70 factor, ECF subfamily
MRLLSDASMLRALRAGDEGAFAELIDTYSSMLLRVALTHTPSRAVAEEVVQETWLGVINGLDRFEGRSSLKTWIFRILTNTAITRGSRERRSVPFSARAALDGDGGETSVDPDRFLSPDHERWPGYWELGPTPWPTPEEGLLAGETRDVILDAIHELPANQRTVITLRDVEGWPAEEVCDALEISEGNQRVLLHRARARVRAALECHFDAVDATVPA